MKQSENSSKKLTKCDIFMFQTEHFHFEAKIPAKFRFKAKVMHTFATCLPDLTNFRLNMISFAYCLLTAGLLNSFNGFGFYIFVLLLRKRNFARLPILVTFSEFFPQSQCQQGEKINFFLY